MSIEKSLALVEQAKKLIRSGTSTLSKVYARFPQSIAPAYIVYGKGCKVWDADGNEFYDISGSLGPVILGYNYQKINKAIIKQLEDGIVFPLPHPSEVELAKTLTKIVPCAEMVHFGKNGSDMTSAAIRLARRITGREHIVQYGYHGFQDWYVAGQDYNLGVPKCFKDLIHKFKYNDIESLETILKQYECAAVILEPVLTEEPKDNFLQKVVDISHQYGALVIFDEVVQGFRMSLGGAQAYYNVVPDLSTCGKAVANGMPLSILCGKREYMEKMDLIGSSTFASESLSIAAAIATIIEMKKKNVIEHLWKQGKKIVDCCNENIARTELPIKITGIPVHFFFTFPKEGGGDDLEVKTVFLAELVKRKVLSNGTNNTMFMHKDEDVEFINNVITEVFDVMSVEYKKSGNVKALLRCPIIEPVFRKVGD